MIQILWIDHSDLCAALIFGINANPVFAKDASSEVFDGATEKDVVAGLQKIEDGSVVSNIHTSKWRVFTDKGREFFIQASRFSFGNVSLFINNIFCIPKLVLCQLSDREK